MAKKGPANLLARAVVKGLSASTTVAVAFFVTTANRCRYQLVYTKQPE